MELQNKSVLITGGAVRVGRAILLELARAGCRIACHYHKSKSEALLVKQAVEKTGGAVQLLQSDLSEARTLPRLVQKTVDTFGQIDILINNAAIFFKTPLGSVSYDDWDRLHRLNLRAAFFLAQEAAKYMIRQKSGKIINIGDAGAENPYPGYIPYSITKAGIMAMTRGLAKALAPHVQVNCINPGPVLMPPDMTIAEREFAVDQTLLKREGTPQDIARAVRFLLEDADYTTGAMIPVDGGRHIR